MTPDNQRELSPQELEQVQGGNSNPIRPRLTKKIDGGRVMDQQVSNLRNTNIRDTTHIPNPLKGSKRS